MNARGALHAWDRLTHPEEQPVWFADRKRLEALVYPPEPAEGEVRATGARHTPLGKTRL